MMASVGGPSPMFFAGYAVFSTSPSFKTRTINLGPFGTWLPAAPDGYSGQAAASFVHLNSVSFFHSVIISTAILRAVATAALPNPRLAASRKAQLFKRRETFNPIDHT